MATRKKSKSKIKKFLGEFTLIELMIIIAIISLLLAIIIPWISRELSPSVELSDMKSILIPYSDLDENGIVTDEEIESRLSEVMKGTGMIQHYNINTQSNEYYKNGEKLSRDEGLLEIKKYLERRIF